MVLFALSVEQPKAQFKYAAGEIEFFFFQDISSNPCNSGDISLQLP